MKRKNGFHLLFGGLALCVSLLTPGVARPAIIPIGNPGDMVPGTGQVYTTYTTLLPITVPNFTDFGSLSDANLTASFSTALNARTAPGGGWASWSAAPFSERPAAGIIRVAFYPLVTPLTISLNDGVDLFGFELEGNAFEVNSFTAEYFSGATSLGVITRSIDGSGGARLFAAIEPGSALIDRVVVSGNDSFAIAQVRYHLGAEQVIPEPTSVMLVSLGGVAVAGYLWRRRRQQLA
jgi:hypothetical protein